MGQRHNRHTELGLCSADNKDTADTGWEFRVYQPPMSASDQVKKRFILRGNQMSPQS